MPLPWTEATRATGATLPEAPTLAGWAAALTAAGVFLAWIVNRGRAIGALESDLRQMREAIDEMREVMRASAAESSTKLDHLREAVAKVATEQARSGAQYEAVQRDLERLDGARAADPRQRTIDHLGRRHEG